MHFLNGATLKGIDGQSVLVIVDTGETVDSISATALMINGELHIDCVPPLNRKYVVKAPDSATVSRAVKAGSPADIAIIVQPSTEAGSFILNLIRTKQISRN